MAACAVPATISANAANHLCMFPPMGWAILCACGVRALLPIAGRLLEGVRELQHAEVVAVAADDLQADRQAFAREAGGHRDRGMAGRGDPVAALHPVDVIIEPHAGDLGRVGLIDGKGRYLVHRADEEVVALEERT